MSSAATTRTPTDGTGAPLCGNSKVSARRRENADSRIYLGIHWSFDADEGITIGNAVADYAFHKYLRPLR